MSKEQNHVKDAIKAYLDERAKNDEQFAQSYAKANKNIDECFDYVIGEAHKRGNAVYMTDKEKAIALLLRVSVNRIKKLVHL